MNSTRDVRTLREYIEHFKNYGREVYFDPCISEDIFGVIETRESKVIFIPILYHGQRIYGIDVLSIPYKKQPITSLNLCV